MSSFERRQEKPVGPAAGSGLCGGETIMAKSLSREIIIALALLAAGGRSVKDQET